MAIVLGPNQYGKAEVRLVHVDRSTAVHKIKDVNVTSQLIGDFTATHSTGDNSAVIATDTQKNTVYALARLHGVGAIEDFALRMARNFVDKYEQVTGARQAVEEYFWDRIITADGTPHDHSFSKGSPEVRTTVVIKDGDAETVSPGCRTSRVLKSTGSEFWGFPMSSTPRWSRRPTASWPRSSRRAGGTSTTDVDWDKTYASVRSIMLDKFAAVHSLSLQQTLYAMGEAVFESHPEIAEMRLSMPNKHHFLVDLSKWGLDNPNEVWYAADRPYGLIEASIIRDDLPPAPEAWLGVKGFI